MTICVLKFKKNPFSKKKGYYLQNSVHLAHFNWEALVITRIMTYGCILLEYVYLFVDFGYE